MEQEEGMRAVLADEEKPRQGVIAIKEENASEQEDCQRIATEDGPSRYLKRGWKVVTPLPSGKIVICNEE